MTIYLLAHEFNSLARQILAHLLPARLGRGGLSCFWLSPIRVILDHVRGISSASRANVGQTAQQGQPFKQPQFPRPVRQRQAQPLTSGCPARSCASMSAISRRQRAIHAAAFRRSSAISSNVRPSPSSVAFLPAERLPALDDHIHVLRIQFHAAADALGQFRGGQRGAAAEERLVDQLAALECGSGSGAASVRRASGSGGRTSPRRSRP